MRIGFSEDNSDFGRKEFAVTFKRPCQITQVSNIMDVSLLTFREKMEVGHFFSLTKNDYLFSKRQLISPKYFILSS